MIQEVKKISRVYQTVKGGHSLALMEGSTLCNRRCSHCDVWKRGNNQDASTISQTFGQIDDLAKLYAVLNYVGGEPLLGCQFRGGVETGRYAICRHGMHMFVEDYTKELDPYRTKEGLTYIQHTLKVIEHASKSGMITNVTTNGDFLDNAHYLWKLKKAGLDFLTFSLHSYNDKGLVDIIQKARVVAQIGIIPIVSVVFTANRADTIPQYARTCAANGVLFSSAVVQEIGGGFSSVPAKSQIPSADQQRKVFGVLEELKKSGFVRNNLNYLRNAINFPGNSWRCDPEKDSFIHVKAVGEKGEVGVCSEVRTGLNTAVDLESDEWRERKRALLKEKCKHGCLYSCFYEAENPNLRGDFRTVMNMLLIRMGQAGLVKWLGERAMGKNSDIIPVPQSEMEKIEAEIVDYYKLPNKLKRKGLDLIHLLEMPAVFALAVGGLALIYLQARRGKVDPEEVFQAIAVTTVYPGLLDNDGIEDSL